MQAKWENEFCVIMSLRETWARIKKENEKSQLESKVNFNRVGNSGRVTKIQKKKNCFQNLFSTIATDMEIEQLFTISTINPIII